MKTLFMLGLLLGSAFGFSLLPNVARGDDAEAPAVEARDKVLLEKLKAYEGTYFLASKEDGTNCFNMLDSQDQDVRLRVSVQPSDDQYGARAGGVKVELQQYWSRLKEWGRVFDRADFNNVNEAKTVQKVSGMKITHEASYNEKRATLTHVSAMSKFLEGRSSAQQLVEFFPDKGEFRYTYSFESSGSPREVACKAIFKRRE